MTRATAATREPAAPIRVGMIGTGLMSRFHLSTMLPRDDTRVVAICEPSPVNYAGVASVFGDRGLDVPPNEPDWTRFLERFGGDLDAVIIITPHVFHHDQASAALQAGLDVYLEKPMVMTAAEAESLIATRDRTGRLLVVGFQGSLSPRVRAATRLIASGEVGDLLSIAAVAWQDWQSHTTGTWRQDPAMSGGGFLFDTGAHMLNTVCDLAGRDVVEVSAWLEDDGAPVDLRGVVLARLAGGALVTMHGNGRTIPTLGSDIRVFCERAIIRTGIWGEHLEIQRLGERKASRPRSVRDRTVWEQFLAVRAGTEPNPSPPEVGLRMARLWDAIRLSSERGGAIVRPTEELAA